MNSIAIISLLLSLTVMSLFVVNFVNRRETRRRLITQRIFAMRRRIGELEEMAATLEPLLESTQIPRAINDEIVSQIETIMKLDPSNEFMGPNLIAAKKLSEELALEKRSYQLMRALSSDAQVARCKFQLNEAIRLVRKNQQIGRIDALEADTFIKDLSWAMMMIKVVTYVNQGHVSIKHDEALKAYGYYKHAQQVLISNPHPDQRRHRLIREVSDILAGRRRSLSEDLMPENANNPPEEPTAVPAPETKDQPLGRSSSALTSARSRAKDKAKKGR
jgi:hypothetical protein